MRYEDGLDKATSHASGLPYDFFRTLKRPPPGLVQKLGITDLPLTAKLYFYYLLMGWL